MAANSTSTLYGTSIPRYNSQLPEAKRQEVYGLQYPLGIGGKEKLFSKISGIEMIRASVKQLLSTERGERVMLPNYGCNLRRFLFQPLDEQTFNEIRSEILFSFNNYIVGANVVRLGVFPTGESGPLGGNSLRVILTLSLDTNDLQIFEVEVILQ